MKDLQKKVAASKSKKKGNVESTKEQEAEEAEKQVKLLQDV